MHKATATNSTLTIWDAIAPNRQRFNTVKTQTIADVIRAAAASIPPPARPAPLLPRSPYVNARGQMTDGAAHARWIAEQNNGLHQAPAMPCRNPRDRGSFSASQYCICGHAMSVHVGGH